MKKEIKAIIDSVLGLDVVLEKPKDLNLGHFATPIAFSLAKEYRKNPMLIAEELANKFKDSKVFESVSAVRGFVNFKLSNSYLEELANKAIKNRYFGEKISLDDKILLEFVSANPTGPLHIGHARGAIFGDTFSKVGKYLGYNITTEYYINDAGSQIELLGLSVYLVAKEYIFNEDVEYPEKYYRGEYLLDIAKEAIDKFGVEVIDDKKLDILAELAKDKVMELIKKDLSNLGIEFDNFVSEKSLYDKWDDIKQELEKNGALYEKDNKLWLNSTKYGDELDRVVVREDGKPTYLAGDIIYHSDKFKRGFNKLIDIWGADHHGYIKRVKASLEFLGFDSNNLEIILSQMVSLLKDNKPFKMSKRAGNVILLSDVYEEIGKDALRFIFLTKKTDTHLEFDVTTLKQKDSSNPVYYIQYAYARINQLFKKANKNLDSIKDIQLQLDDNLKNILYKALLMQDILEEAFEKRDMQKITDYLYSLASMVHKFYNETKIIGNSNEDSILKTLAVVMVVFEIIFNLLEITIKEEM